MGLGPKAITNKQKIREALNFYIILQPVHSFATKKIKAFELSCVNVSRKYLSESVGGSVYTTKKSGNIN